MNKATRRLKSTYNHRVTPAVIKANFKSAEDAFNKGDYLAALDYEDAPPEIRARALALGGYIEKSVELFSILPTISSVGLVIFSYALWSLKEDKAATKILDRIANSDPAFAIASDLRQLINAEEIPAFIVAAHIPLFAERDPKTVNPSYRCGRFLLKHVASQLEHNEYEIGPSGSFADLIDSLPINERPLFAYAGLSHWMLPNGFAEADLPKIIWAHDSDFFFHRDPDRFRAFDIAIMSTSQEHHELSRSLGIACHSNILSDPLMRLPDPEGSINHDKPIDILFSGASVASHTVEKARFVYDLADLADDHNIVIVDGHLTEPDYMALLSSAKFLPIVNRYYGNPSPRWRDALSAYTYVLNPEGAPFGELSAGFFAFRHDSIVQDIRQHLDGFRVQEKGAPYDMTTNFENIAQRFPKRENPRAFQFERNLKLCAYLTISRRHSPTPQRVPSGENRRVWLTPQIDCLMFGRDNIIKKVCGVVETTILENCTTPTEISDLAALHAQLSVVGDDPNFRDRHASAAIDVLKHGIERFPKSFMLRYNNAHWRFIFEKCSIEQSIAEFKNLIDLFETLELSPVGDDIGLGYAGYSADKAFPSFEYAEFILSSAVRTASTNLSGEAMAGARTMLRSALHGFVGWGQAKAGNFDAALEFFNKALELLPGNRPLAELRLDTVLAKIERYGRKPCLWTLFFLAFIPPPT